MQIENVAFEIELFKNNVSVKKFMCPAIFINQIIKQLSREYKMNVVDVRPSNYYVKTVEIT